MPISYSLGPHILLKQLNKQPQGCTHIHSHAVLPQGFCSSGLNNCNENGSSVPCSLKPSTDRDMFTNCLTAHKFVERDTLLSPVTLKELLSFSLFPANVYESRGCQKAPKTKAFITIHSLNWMHTKVQTQFTMMKMNVDVQLKFRFVNVHGHAVVL